MTWDKLRVCAMSATVMWSCQSINPSAATGASFKKVALTNEAAPGTPSGVVFNGFVSPVLNGNGQTAFRATLSGPGVVEGVNDEGMWAERADTLGLVVRLGDSAPGGDPGEVFAHFPGNPTINNAGQVLIFATHTAQGGPFLPYGVWLSSNGSIFKVISKGDPAPGTGGSFNFFANFPALSEDGQVTFASIVAGPGINILTQHGIWTASPGGLDLQARASGPVFDPMTGGTAFLSFAQYLLDYNGEKQITFTGRIMDDGIDVTSDFGWVSGTSGSLVLLARQGKHAPGLAAGETILNFSTPPQVNKLGHSIVSTSLAGPDVDDTNYFAVWAHDGDALRIVARNGQSAPGTEAGVVFKTMQSEVLSDTGQAAFVGTLTGPVETGIEDSNDTGVWMERDGSLQMIIREGDWAPGTPQGTRFIGFSEPKFNGIGQALLEASVTQPADSDTFNSGVWLIDTDGSVSLVLKRGDVIDVNDDALIEDLRTVNFIDRVIWFGSSGGSFHNFNEAGQIAMRLGFTDGTEGIFLATVPEPGVLLSIMIGLPWVLRRPD